MRRRVVWIVAVVALLVASATTALAVAFTGSDHPWPSRGDGTMSSQRSDRPDGRDWQQQPGWQGIGGRMSGGMHGMRAGSEYAYLAEMVAHHKEAVATAQQLQRSPRAEMRAFGEAIVASQSAQIDQMQQWLSDWYPDRAGQVDYRPMMRELTGLSGNQLDQVFLQDMIWHHMAAVMASQQLLMRGVAEHGQVEVLAEAIRDEQHAEIFKMQQWLRDWFGLGRQHGMRLFPMP